MGISVTGYKLEEHWSCSSPETVHPQHSKVSQPSGLVAQLAECSHGKREAVGSIRDKTILKEIETGFFSTLRQCGGLPRVGGSVLPGNNAQKVSSSLNYFLMSPIVILPLPHKSLKVIQLLPAP